MGKRILLTDEQHSEFMELQEAIRELRTDRANNEIDDDDANEAELELAESIVEAFINMDLTPAYCPEPEPDGRGGFW